MSSFVFYLAIVFHLHFLHQHQVYSIPTCIIIDTNIKPPSENHSSSLLLRNLRMLDHQRASLEPEFLVESIPLSYIDIETTPPPSLNNLDHSLLEKSLTDSSTIQQASAECSLKLLDETETQMLVPFEFRRLRIEQSDHQTKFLDDDPRETVPDLSTVVYERRSDPDGVRFCRTCRDGLWTELTICETVRCDVELLRANPRLVTEWGEIQTAEDGALYAPTTVFAVYAFASGPHCKQCEANGQWSHYALPETCREIKFFRQSTVAIPTITKNLDEKV